MVNKFFKTIYVLCTANPLIDRLLSHPARNIAVIFYMHRFEDPEHGSVGITAPYLESALQTMKKYGCNFVSVQDIIEARQGKRKLPPKAVAFTIDDGFIDQATIAAPIFIKYKCPVTIGLITGFIDGNLWPWDSRLRYMFTATEQEKIDLAQIGLDQSRDIRTNRQRMAVMREVRDYLKKVGNQEHNRLIQVIAELLNVHLTDVPAQGYQPMTWGQARELEKIGVTIASHSATHAVISRCSPDEMKEEIDGSWKRLRSQLGDSLNIFIYPTGRIHDFGMREISYLQDNGYSGALTTVHGYVDIVQTQSYKSYMMSRISFPEDLLNLKMVCSPFMRIAEIFIGRMRLHHRSARILINNYLYKVMSKISSGAADIDLTQYDRLVFVCKGNVCRSPFAEQLARSFGFNAISCGFETDGNIPANDEAIHNAKTFGIDLESHRSRNLTSIYFNERDCIFIMEPDHIVAVHKMIDRNIDIYLLGMFSNPSRLVIHDPYKKGVDEFQYCYNGIYDSLFRLRGRVE
ncbi:MAG: polysaccharide deacetylase family protein [Gammaproteobacteria bacterium]|nr:polysaccharide deacetylase family protein [Gammaproteobacteria bacterium]